MHQLLYLLLFLLSMAVALHPSPARAQAKVEAPAATGQADVRYEAVSEGTHLARVFATAAQRDVRIEVQDLILGAGKGQTNVPLSGFHVTELESGEIETSIDGHVERRKPGNFWIVHPGQTYQVRNLAGMAVLHTVVITKK